MKDKEHEHGDFAEGQDAAEGQSEDHPHPEDEGKEGDFAEGQEASPEHGHEEGSFAEGQEKDHDEH